MSLFRVTIDEFIYEGTYTTEPDAVFGAMRKCYNDRQEELYSGRANELYGKGRMPFDDPDYRAGREAYSAWVAAPKLIAVERLTDRPGRGRRGKARRVGTVGEG